MTHNEKTQISKNVVALFPVGTLVYSKLDGDSRTFTIETRKFEWINYYTKDNSGCFIKYECLVNLRLDGGTSSNGKYRIVWSDRDGYGTPIPPTKETKMLDVDLPHKKWFHTFDYKDRIITLVLIRNNADNTLSSGYSVKHMDDDMNEELGQRIAIGRASTARTNLLPNLPMIDKSIINQFVAKAIMETLEFKIKRGIIEIKGIR